MKVYELVKRILREFPVTRSSDKELIWRFWLEADYARENVIFKEDFFNSPSTETITRCRRKIQETHHELRATDVVQDFRKARETKKGNFIFQDVF